MARIKIAPGLLKVMAAALLAAAATSFAAPAAAPSDLPGDLEPLRYNNPGLEVDLGVGLWAWPLPLDWDLDGDLDLVVSCPDEPSSGTFLFENPGGGELMPVFKPAVRVGPALRNAQISYVNGTPRILTPATEWLDFRGKEFDEIKIIFPRENIHPNKVRANQWRYVDYDGDGDQDLIVGVGDWTDYGWDNAFDAEGRWTRGPLRGFIYLLANDGNGDRPSYAAPRRLEAGGEIIEQFGMPSPNFADFDGDGDHDLLCGEFLDGFTYYENVGSRAEPNYSAGSRLKNSSGEIRMHLQMITPTAIDWDGDGDFDLIVGDEDGRVALVEHTGNVVDGIPQFNSPRYFRQQADTLKFGALVTPVSVDWDEDGDEDLICGNTAGELGFFENFDGGDPPRWAAPVLLEAQGETIRIQAGPNGSIQGPAEAKWGYTVPGVGDWDQDGRIDILINSIWGRIVWFRNIGEKGAPRLAAAAPVEVDWPAAPPKPAWNWWRPAPRELATQWRTTPLVIDWNGDGLNDLLMLDHDGFLALFPRRREGDRLMLGAGERIFDGGVYGRKNEFVSRRGALRLNPGEGGASGRRKFCVTDWDSDGHPDLMVDSVNVDFLRNAGPGADGRVRFENRGPVSNRKLAGHTTSPTTVDWDGDGVRDLLIGAEDGRLYLMRKPAAAMATPPARAR